MHRIAAPLRRSRVLWAIVCWVIAGVLGGFGGPFLVTGLRATSVPKAYAVVVEFIPGGVHTYGGLMLSLALALVHGLLPSLHGRSLFDAWLIDALFATAAFTFSVALAFGASWVLSGTITYQAIVLWLMLTVLALGAALFPPDPPDKAERVA